MADLGKLDDRIAAIQEQLSKLKARRQLAYARQTAHKLKRGRKEDTRRKILAGAVVLDRAARGELEPAMLRTWLDADLARPDDRRLFDLPPR
jgi:large subunit ribosomal protein L7/L12